MVYRFEVRGRARAFIALVALIAGVALALAQADAARANVAGHFLMGLETPATFPDLEDAANRSSYIVLQAWAADVAADLKAENPNVRVLVYQDLAAMSDLARVDGLTSSGVGFDEADTAHPEWFLLDDNGDRLYHQGWRWLWMADIGNVAYQQRWTDNVLDLLESGPWDGVFMDDTNPTVKYHTDPDRVALYPTDEDYQAAVESMLAYAGPAISRAGYLTIPNFGAWVEYPDVIEDWLAYVDGGMDEKFLKWDTAPGVGYRDSLQWRIQLDEVATAESMGKIFLGITTAGDSDTQARRYGWASMLLVAQGRAAYVAAAAYDGWQPWSSDYDIDLGRPTTAITAVGNGAYTRTFADGLVVVNPTSSPLFVSFGGTYSGSGLTRATSAIVAAKTGLVLTPA